MSEIIEKLKKNRDIILLTEIVGWLHDIGKLDNKTWHQHNERIRTEFGIDIEDRDDIIPRNEIPENVFNFLIENTPKSFVRSRSFSIDLNWFAGNSEIGGPIFYHHYYNPNIPRSPYEHIIALTDTQDSKEDRGAHEEDKPSKIMVSTPFGYEEKLETSGLREKRKDFYKKFAELLNKFQQENSPKNFRMSVHDLVKEYFSSSLAETRRPANDIVLYDHCYMVGSLAKSVVSAWIINPDFKETIEKIKESSGYFKFKLLVVGYRGYEFLTKVNRLADFIGRTEILSEIRDKVRNIVEFEIPIGNLIYEDMSIMCFLVPDLDEAKEGMEIKKEIKERIVEEFRRGSNGILLPFVGVIGDRDGKSSEYIGTLIKNAKEIVKKRLKYPYSELIDLPWANEWAEKWMCVDCKKTFRNPMDKKCPECGSKNIKKREKCFICGYSPETPIKEGVISTRGEKLCKYCYDIRLRGAKKRHTEEKGTIWLDELRDENNNIALIVGKMTPIQKWLSGELVEKAMRTVFCNPVKGKGKIEKVNKIRGLFKAENNAKVKIYEDVRRAIRHKPDALKLLKEKIGESNISDGEIQNLIEKVFELCSGNTPSPSRLRRIWQEFMQFSEDSETSLKSFFEEQKLIRKRIKMKVDGEIKKKEYMLGDAKLEGKDIGCVIYEGERTILTANYLDTEFEFDGEKQKLNEYSKEDLKDLLKGKILEIKWYDGTSTEAKIEEVVNIEPYIPMVPVYKTVGEFMILCPAKYALTLTTRIKAHFFKRFEKALGKLGLNIGLLYFKYKQPLYLVLDGGRRFIEEFESGDLRKEDETREYEILKNEDLFIVDKLGWNITPKFEDGSEDWYYCTLKDAITNEYVPILKMKDNKIKVFHNYFDYEYMESTQKRFDITFGERSKRFHSVVGEQGPRPYLLEDVGKIIKLWDIIDPEKGNLTISQIMKLKHICSEKIEEWGLKNKDLRDEGTFRTLVEASVENICGDIGKSEKETIIRSVIEGYFFDVVELFIKLEQILSPFDVISFFADFQYNKEEGKRAERWLLKQVGGLNANP